MLLSSTQSGMSETALLTARTTTLVALLTIFACILGYAPIAAFGDADEHAVAARAEVQEALEVRAEVEQVNEAAREQAPPAVGTRCDRTLEVEGIGDTCVTSDGLLRVEQADGRSHTIHGLDAPPVGASAYTPSSQTAIANADASDINCVDPSQPHYTLVYARPGDVASRYGTIAPLLRDEAYKVGAYIDSEARAVDPTASRKLPVSCDGATPTVREATLSSLTNGTARFADIVDALRAQGYEYNNNGTGRERYIIYYDSPSPTGAAGTGHVFTLDSRGDASNANNNGGLYAVEYRFADGGGVPHWEVLIHEVIHTMGAIVNTAPHSTSAGHCTDGQDIMCYRDSQSSTYDPSVCATKVLDCNRDDYFNPAPAAGSYLATHWNTAATYNRFLVSSTAASEPTTNTGTRTPTSATNDVTPPAAPARLRARQVGGRISFWWGASTDDVGVSRYELRLVSGRRRTAGSTAATRLWMTTRGLRVGSVQTFEVVARDAASNVSSGVRVRLRVTRDRVRPTMPSRLRAAATTRNSVTLAWNPSRDEAGIRGYEVYQLVRGRWTKLRMLRAGGRSIRVIRLRARTAHSFRVVAVDANGNRSLAGRGVRTRTR